MTSKGKSAQVDGGKIKQLREAKHGTQQRLADKSGVTIKTIQRAEKGMAIDPNVANEIAKALNVDAQEILTNGEGSENAVEHAPANHEYLRLKRLTTAKRLFDAAKAQILDFEFELDLDESTAIELADFIEPMEELNSKTIDSDKKTTASEQLRVIGKVSDGLKTLGEKDICVFTGFTTYRETNTEEYPTEYDYEHYVHSITHKTKAVVQFGKCDSKTTQALTYIGLTHQEAQDWLEKKFRDGASNTSVKWDGYTEVKKVKKQEPAMPDLDDEIPF